MTLLSFSEFCEIDESFTPGKTVYTSHTDKVLKGKIVGKDDDNEDQYLVNHRTGTGKNAKDDIHSVHKDAIHAQRAHAGFMHDGYAAGRTKAR